MSERKFSDTATTTGGQRRGHHETDATGGRPNDGNFHDTDTTTTTTTGEKDRHHHKKNQPTERKKVMKNRTVPTLTALALFVLCSGMQTFATTTRTGTQRSNTSLTSVMIVTLTDGSTESSDTTAVSSGTDPVSTLTMQSTFTSGDGSSSITTTR